MPVVYQVNPQTFSPPEYGQDDNIISTVRIKLDDALDLKEIAIGGSMLWAQQASSKSAWVNLRINDQLRGPIKVQEGLMLSGARFSRVFASCDAQAGEWIDIVYAAETKLGLRVENPASQFASVSLEPGSSFTHDTVTVGVAATLIKAANTSRKSITIQAFGGPIYIGGAAVAVADGFYLAAGSSVKLSNTAAVYGIAGANTDVRYFEET